jgi:hypothetical protein
VRPRDSATALPWYLGATKVRILYFKNRRPFRPTVAFETTIELFTRASPNNSLERLTERSVGLVTDRPSNIYELLVTLLQ